MFSCCRTNPNKPKSTTKKDKNKADNDKSEQQEIKTNDNKLIIPTITVENGKSSSNDNLNENNGDDDSTASVYGSSGTNSVDGTIDYAESVDNIEIANADKVASVNADDVPNAPTSLAGALTETAVIKEKDINVVVVQQETETIAETVAKSDQNYVIDTTTKTTSSPTSTPTIAEINQQSNNKLSKNKSALFKQEIENQTIEMTTQVAAEHESTISMPTAAAAAAVVAAVEATNSLQCAASSEEKAEARPNTKISCSTKDHRQQQQHHTDLPPRSCLSRHNSTHTSIKKKVNISTEPEIIESEPLPPPPYDLTSPSLGDVDDDVFSDSLPPPKRDSMCAPYIERDIDADVVAFAHGLPEWFNNERINDIGCIEPPVTPVGRDELELKRQRLYADLLRAAHAAVEHNVRFAPFVGADMLPNNNNLETTHSTGGDCDPDLKPSVAENLEHLVNRLEKLVERLERSISARELEIANRTFDTVLEKQKRASFDIESAALPPVPGTTVTTETVTATITKTTGNGSRSGSGSSISQEITEQTDHLNQRIERIESSLNRINDRHSNSQSSSISLTKEASNSLENIPTVLADYQAERELVTALVQEEDQQIQLVLLPPPPPPLPLEMSVYGYQDIINGPLSQYLALSAKIGGDVAKQAELVKLAFDAQFQYVTLATQCAKPSQDKQMELLKPTSAQISAIQEYREKQRSSPYFNHLSAISESIPALGWVCVAPTPGPHVKEMNDAGQFYTNRVLKDWKEKDTKHVEWARAWVQTLAELQAYIKQYHTTGLVWSGKGAPSGGAAPPPPPPIGACPPPPAFDLATMSLDDDADERSALFAEINQGEAITKNLKKVTADMQTHKNTTLRAGPAPFKKPTNIGGSNANVAPQIQAKEPVFARDGKKWLIEYQKNNSSLLVDNAEMNNVVYMFKCEGSTLTVKGKVNNIVLDSCKKCSLLFDSVVASIEFVNCQSVQMQTLGFVPTVSIDKTDGCQMYLSNESMGVEVVSSKSSEMNIMLPAANGDYTELAVPEQFKTTISGKTLKTVCVDSLG